MIDEVFFQPQLLNPATALWTIEAACTDEKRSAEPLSSLNFSEGWQENERIVLLQNQNRYTECAI